MAVEIGIKTKKCSRCGKDKPLDKFTRHRAYHDGYCYWCKECRSVYRKQQQVRRQAKSKILPIRKQCTKCGEVKAGSEFYKSKQSSDGLRTWCIDCEKHSATMWQRRDREHRKRQASEQGIDTQEQAEAVVQKLAILRRQLILEHTVYEQGLQLRKTEFLDRTESIVVRWRKSYLLLLDFIERGHSCRYHTTQPFRFGIARYDQGKMSLELYCEKAYKAMESSSKP